MGKALMKNAMQLHGNSAVAQAHTRAITRDDNHAVKQECFEDHCNLKLESPTLAGYIVYVITVLGFLTMCVSSAFR